MNDDPVPHRPRSFWQIAFDILRKAPRPSPLWEPDPDKPRARRLSYSDTERRSRFIEAYNRNAMNFLPSAIVHNIYRVKGTQRSVEDRARSVLEGADHLHIAARARGYTG